MLNKQYIFIGHYFRKLIWFEALSAVSTVLFFIYIFVYRNVVDRTEMYIIGIVASFLGVSSFERMNRYRKPIELAFGPNGLYLRGYPVRKSSKAKIKKVSSTQIVLEFNRLYAIQFDGNAEDVESLLSELHSMSAQQRRALLNIHSLR